SVIQNLSSDCAVVKASSKELLFDVSRFLVSLEFARMTRSFELGVVTVTFILNKKAQKQGSGLW
ncbi:TPA: hypothetical protein ACVOY8_004635, partial [Vibrio diabolicus]